jgi:hypothetical protein
MHSSENPKIQGAELQDREIQAQEIVNPVAEKLASKNPLGKGPEAPLISLRYSLSLPEAQEGFRLATRQRKGKAQYFMALACALVIVWGFWLGIDGQGRYFVILGAFFFLSQAMLQYAVLPWLFRRQYEKHQVANVLQGIDIYASKVTLYHGIENNQDREHFALHNVKSLNKGQLSYVLVFETGMMCMVPRRCVEQANVSHLFEQSFLKETGS